MMNIGLSHFTNFKRQILPVLLVLLVLVCFAAAIKEVAEVKSYQGIYPLDISLVKERNSSRLESLINIVFQFPD